MTKPKKIVPPAEGSRWRDFDKRVSRIVEVVGVFPAGVTASLRAFPACVLIRNVELDRAPTKVALKSFYRRFEGPLTEAGEANIKRAESIAHEREKLTVTQRAKAFLERERAFLQGIADKEKVGETP